METPSEILAKRITERLVKEGLITDKKTDEIMPKMASGKLSSEDWRLYIELRERKEAKP